MTRNLLPTTNETESILVLKSLDLLKPCSLTWHVKICTQSMIPVLVGPEGGTHAADIDVPKPSPINMLPTVLLFSCANHSTYDKPVVYRVLLSSGI